MGLDITAYSEAILMPEHEDHDEDECYDQHVRAFAYRGFERSYRGLADPTSTFEAGGASFIGGRWYNISGARVADFQAGSYLGYSRWRSELSRAALGVTPEDIWRNIPRFTQEPFFELIHFADNEGCIGPAAAADLARDFSDHREQVFAAWEAAVTPPLLGFYREKYEGWADALTLAAGSGLVRFH